MNINLYRNNEIICELPVDDSAVCLCKIMGEHSIKMKVTVAEPLVLQVGDYLMEDGIPFTLYDEADFTHAAGTYTYQLTFYAPYYQLNYVYHKSEATTKFDYYGGVREHLTLLLNSMHELDGGFALGEVEENGTQLLNFDKTYCLAALNKICEAFKLEYRFDGKTLHVKQRVGVDRDYIFRYGRNNGLYSLERQGVTNRSVVTKLAGKGGSSNLPVDYRHDETPIPDTLVFGKRHLTMNTAKYGIREDEKTFEDIYPRLKDKKVLSVEVPADIDKATAWKLKLDIPFDLNAQLAPEKDALVHFTSGELQGESFSIVNKSFNPETQELRIIVSDNDGYVLPRASRQPRVGDSFVLLDIIMPADPYVTEAEAELEARTLEELKKICVRQFAHKLSLQERYIRKNNIRLQAGDKVTVKDSAAGLDALIRITEVNYPLASPHKLSVLLSDEILYSYDQKIRNDINDITADVVNAYRQIQNTSRRAWKDARELSDMIQGLEAELLLVGNPEGQFTVTSVFKTNKNNNPNNFIASAGTLQHKVYTDNPATGIWSMEPYTMVLEKNVPYFLYARCSKVNRQGVFMVSETAKEVEDADYYYFRVGLISSVFENARILKTTSGFTQIAGGDITAEKLQDAQQRLVIDLVNAVIEAREGAVIRGKIEFKSISGDYKDVETTIDEKATAAGTTAAQEKIDGLQFGGVNCCDNFKKWNYLDSSVSLHDDGNSIVISTTPGVNSAVASHAIKRTGEFAVSLDIETSGNTHIYIDPRGVILYSSHEQYRSGICFDLPANFKDRIIIYAKSDVEINDNFYFAVEGISPTLSCKFSYPQLEAGNKASAWSPSLADQKADIQEKIDGLQIGGVNLINSSKGTFEVNSERYWNRREYEPMTPGKTYIFHADDCKINGVDNKNVTIIISDGDYVGALFYQLNIPFVATKNYKYVAITNNGDGRVISIENIMLEAGNKASAWSPSLADQQASIQEKIDGLQFGGVNLLEISRGIVNYSQYNSQWIIKNNGRILESTYVGNLKIIALNNNCIFPQGLYTISGYMKINNQPVKSDSFYCITQYGTCLKNTIDGSTGKFESVIESPNVGVGWIIHPFIEQLVVGDVITIEDFKIEKGNKATAWSPSLADQKADIQAKIDGLQIGTVNVFNHSGNFTDSNQNWRDNGGGLILDSATKYNDYNTIKTVVGAGILGDWYKLENGVEYTYCAMIKSNADLIGTASTPLHYWTGKDYANQSKMQIIKYDTSFKAGEWKLAYVTFKLIDDADSFIPFIYMGSGNTVFNIAFLALVKGNRPLEQWSPSLADQDYLFNSLAVEADGVVLANRMSVKDTSGNITGFMDGNPAATSIPYLIGGMQTPGNYGSAKFRINKNGDASLLNATVKGTIEALSGKIGGFDIVQQSLSVISGGIEKIRLGNDPVGALSNLSGGWQNIGGTGRFSTTEDFYYDEDRDGYVHECTKAWGSLSLGGFTLTQPAIVRYTSDDNVPHSSDGYIDGIVTIRNSSGQVVYTSRQGQYTFDTQTLPAGSYTARVDLTMGTTRNGNFSATYEFSYESYGFSVEKGAEQTKIGNNGLFSYFNSNAYIYFNPAYGFEFKYFNGGIRCIGSGLQKWNGTTWVAL